MVKNKIWLIGGLALLAACVSLPAPAQKVVAPSGNMPAQGICFGDLNGTATCVSATNPLPVTGGGGGGAGDASAANQTAVQAPIAPATATATKSTVIGTVYNSTPPTFTDGQQGALQIDSSGRLITNCGTGCSGGTPYTEDAPAASDPTGVAIISRRRDTMSTSEVSADGDNIGLISTNKGELRINDNSLNAALGTATDAASQSGNCTGIACLRSMRDDLRTLATDTNPVSTNITQVGGSTIATGNGASNGQTLRVAIANDQTPINLGTNVSTTTTRIASAAASTNLTAISSSACTILRVRGYNAKASGVYLRFYNTASGSVTVGTTTVTGSVYLPASQAFAVEINKYNSTACSFSLTAGSGDSDTTALAAGDILALNVESR